MHLLSLYRALLTSRPSDGVKNDLDLVTPTFTTTAVIVYAHFVAGEPRLNAQSIEIQVPTVITKQSCQWLAVVWSLKALQFSFIWQLFFDPINKPFEFLSSSPDSTASWKTKRTPQWLWFGFNASQLDLKQDFILLSRVYHTQQFFFLMDVELKFQMSESTD